MGRRKKDTNIHDLPRTYISREAYEKVKAGAQEEGIPLNEYLSSMVLLGIHFSNQIMSESNKKAAV